MPNDRTETVEHAPLAHRGAPRRRPHAHRGARWRFWGAAYTLIALLTGTNLPTPLYRGYEESFGLSPLTVTLVFAAYVAALVPTLLIAGPLSDAVGRRRVLLPAVGLAVAGSLVFAAASGAGWLFAARVLQGLALGAASGTLTAALTELEPAGNRRKAALVATAASVGGLGVGPLLAGALAHYAPAPRVLPFLVEVVLLVPAAIAMAALPRPKGHTTARRGRGRPRGPGVLATMRSVFAVNGVAAFLAFAVVGLFLTLIPTYVTELTGNANLLVNGSAVALMLACSALAQMVGYGRSPYRLHAVGLPLLAAGLVLLAAAGSAGSLALLLAATVLAGSGQGLTFLGALTAVNQTAPPDRRADVLSRFYVVVYLGVGLPVVGVGLLASLGDPRSAVQCFAVAVAIVCPIVLGVLARYRRDRQGGPRGHR